jgi:hypothetical protein
VSQEYLVEVSESLFKDVLEYGFSVGFLVLLSSFQDVESPVVDVLLEVDVLLNQEVAGDFGLNASVVVVNDNELQLVSRMGDQLSHLHFDVFVIIDLEVVAVVGGDSSVPP